MNNEEHEKITYFVKDSWDDDMKYLAKYYAYRKAGKLPHEEKGLTDASNKED